MYAPADKPVPVAVKKRTPREVVMDFVTKHGRNKVLFGVGAVMTVISAVLLAVVR